MNAVQLRHRLTRLFERDEREYFLRRATEEHELYRDGGPTYLEYMHGERQLNEHEWLILRVVDLGDSLAELRSFVAQAVPFLEEAWHACFHGQKKRLLSAEERGMGRLLNLFREVAAEQPAIPPGLITCEEASRRSEAAVAWAHKLLGSPNELAPELQEWMSPGETCADGLRRAQAEVDRLREIVKAQRKKDW